MQITNTPCGTVAGCCTGNVRDCHQVSPVAVPGNNTSRDVVIETVHARHAGSLLNVTNKSAAQGMFTLCSNTINKLINAFIKLNISDVSMLVMFSDNIN